MATGHGKYDPVRPALVVKRSSRCTINVHLGLGDGRLRCSLTRDIMGVSVTFYREYTRVVC